MAATNMRNLILSVSLCSLMLSAQTKKIVVSTPDPEIFRELQSASPKIRIVPVTTQNTIQEIADADAFIGTLTPEQVRAGKNLKWVGVMAAGVENVLFMSGGNDLRDSHIVLTNNKVVQGPEIAGHALAMLALSRNLPAFWSAKQQERLQHGPTLVSNGTDAPQW